MLAASLDHERRQVKELPEVLRRFLKSDPLREEAIALLELLVEQNRRPTYPHGLTFAAPLVVHGDYSLIEVMAALGIVTDTDKLMRPQAGVYWVREHRCDLAFVTLEKSEKDYSPTTLYEDYPISPTLFHWQTQSSTRMASPAGKRYVGHGHGDTHLALFVRKRRKDARGETMPYTFLGPATYVKHEGERPMSITWRLAHPMPAEMFEETKVAAG